MGGSVNMLICKLIHEVMRLCEKSKKPATCFVGISSLIIFQDIEGVILCFIPFWVLRRL